MLKFFCLDRTDEAVEMGKTLTLVSLYSMVPSNAFEHITLYWEDTDV